MAGTGAFLRLSGAWPARRLRLRWRLCCLGVASAAADRALLDDGRARATHPARTALGSHSARPIAQVYRRRATPDARAEDRRGSRCGTGQSPSAPLAAQRTSSLP